MPLKRKSTATSVRSSDVAPAGASANSSAGAPAGPSANSSNNPDLFARVTIAIMETEPGKGYLRSVCRAGDAAIRASSDAHPSELFEACESAIFSGALYALRTGSEAPPDRIGLVILDVEGCVEGLAGGLGPDGFALAAAYAVWNALDHAPSGDDVTEVEGWLSDGKPDVADAAGLKFPGPTTIDSVPGS